MKLDKVIGLIILTIFTVTSLSYAYTAMTNLAPDTTGAETAEKVKRAMGDAHTRVDGPNAKKGSPMHAWQDIVRADLGKGKTFTKAKFAEEIRSKNPSREQWSDNTISLELDGLVLMGVLGRTNTPGEYEVLIDATLAQIEEINNAVIPIVDRRGIVRGKRGAVGIDAHRLDANWLGGVKKEDSEDEKERKREIGRNKLNDIRAAIAKITKTTATLVPREEVTQDPVDVMIAQGSVPAPVVVNEEEDRSLIINIAGQRLILYQGVVDANAEFASAGKGETLDTQVLLSNLVDMGLVSSDAKLNDGNVADLNPTKVETVLFKDSFVTSDEGKRFAEEFKGLEENQIAVIISTSDEQEEAIRKALNSTGLSLEWGNKIIVLGVQPHSTAADAFGRLFDAAGPMIGDLNTARKILDSKDATIAIGGAV